MNLLERFMSKVELIPFHSCWEWNGAKNLQGYGRIQTGSRTDGSRFSDGSHRVSWRLHFGEIPKGLDVLHRCDNTGCVNPNHLFLGTARDNIIDCSLKNRLRKKIDDDQVIQIRRSIARGEKCVNLAKKFNVSASLIYQIKQNKKRRHLCS